MGIFDDVIKEKKSKDDANSIKAQEYIVKLENYKKELSKVVADNIAGLLDYVHSNCTYYDTLTMFAIVRVKVASMGYNRGKLCTDGKSWYVQTPDGMYRENSYTHYTQLSGAAMINSVINKCLIVYCCSDYEHDWKIGIDEVINDLAKGKYTYHVISKTFSTFDAVNEYVSVPPEVRVRNWIKSYVK